MPNLPKKTPPSSQVKKLPKEGSRKFVGPASVSSVVSKEVFEADPSLFREWNPRRGPKVGTIKNRMPSSTTRAFEMGFAPKPSATRMVRHAGLGKGAPRAVTGGLTYEEIKAAVNKLNPKLRAKLRNSLAEGLRGSRVPF